MRARWAITPASSVPWPTPRTPACLWSGAINVQSLGTLTSTGTLNLTSSTFSILAASGVARFTAAATFNKGFVSDAGTLSTASLTDTGSTVSVTGSLISTGAAMFTSDTITDGGLFNLGSVVFSQDTFADTGTLIVGGALAIADAGGSVAAGGLLSVGSLNIGANFVGTQQTLSVAGTVTDSGTLGIGASNAGGTVVVQNTGTFVVGGTVSGGAAIAFAGAGVAAFSSTDTNFIQNNVNNVFSGLNTNNGTIDFTGLAFTAGDTYTYASSNGQLNVSNASGTLLTQLLLNKADNYTTFNIVKDSVGGTAITATPC